MSKKMGEFCCEKLIDVASRDASLWLLDGDLADSYGADVFASIYPDRFVACGISEQCMVSLAAGLATCGIRPWVFSFAAFLCYRAYDQIRTGVSQTGLPVTIVGSHAGGCGGRNGKTHLALNDIAIMSTLPNFEVWAPADSQEMSYAIQKIMYTSKPAYVRLPRDPLGALGSKGEDVRWIGTPSGVALCGHGISAHWAKEVQHSLRECGVDIGILQFIKLWPLDSEKIWGLLRDVHTLLVIEDHYSIGGLGTILRSIMGSTKIQCAGWPNDWCGQSGTASELRDYFDLNTSALVKKVHSMLH